jgi:hypothetical protein
MTIDLNFWHHALHQVTGSMALRFNRATPADLEKWAETLRAVAAEPAGPPALLEKPALPFVLDAHYFGLKLVSFCRAKGLARPL